MTDKTLGAYERTTPDPDDMDGGVAAALIEKEAAAGVCCGPLDEDVAFWHARWHEAADQRDARDAAAHLWKETARNAIRTAHGIGWERDQYHAGEQEAEARAEKAEAALEDLREQYGTAVREKDEWEANAEKAEARAESYRVTVGKASAAETAERLRAEKAEKERDAWKVRAEAAEPARDKWREVAKREQGMSDELARQLEATEASLREANGVVKSLRAAESRPLSPEDISDDHATRVADYLRLHGHGIVPHHVMLEALTAVLTEPPARPKGAEEWDEKLGEMPAAFDLTTEQRARLADALAERDHALGVRVATEDGAA